MLTQCAHIVPGREHLKVIAMPDNTSTPVTAVKSAHDLGRVVVARRKARGYSQQEFADLAGVGRRFVSELESGKATAEIGKVLQVLTALGIDVQLRSR